MRNYCKRKLTGIAQEPPLVKRDVVNILDAFSGIFWPFDQNS